MNTQYIFTQNIYRREVVGKQFIVDYFFFFFVSTLSNIGGVVCSAIVSERLKLRKSLAIPYRQGMPSDIELNNNVININKLWGVSTSFVVCYFRFNTIFFNS